MLTAHAVLKGNGYGLKITSRGRLLEIWPMHPDRVEVGRTPT
jgi:phage portal protein BeeE